jgi:RNA polymerase sigma factor (sigma-70 family)
MSVSLLEFETFFEESRPRLISAARRMGLSPADAEDAVQVVAIRLARWHGLTADSTAAPPPPEGEERTLEDQAFARLKLVARDVHRARRSRQGVEVLSLDGDSIERSDGGGGNGSRRHPFNSQRAELEPDQQPTAELRSALKQAFDRLTPEDAGIARAFLEDGKGLGAISAHLGVPLYVVSNRLYRHILPQLRAALRIS